MTEVARNFNHAFDRGHKEFSAGCKTWQNPYQARYARNAWRSGWEKANEEAATVSADRLKGFNDYHDHHPLSSPERGGK